MRNIDDNDDASSFEVAQQTFFPTYASNAALPNLGIYKRNPAPYDSLYFAFCLLLGLCLSRENFSTTNSKSETILEAYFRVSAPG